MEGSNSALITQMADLSRKVDTFNSHFRQPPATVYPPLGWNGHTDLGPQGEQWPGEEEVPSMYPYVHYNNQVSNDQEWNHQ